MFINSFKIRNRECAKTLNCLENGIQGFYLKMTDHSQFKFKKKQVNIIICSSRPDYSF